MVLDVGPGETSFRDTTRAPQGSHHQPPRAAPGALQHLWLCFERVRVSSPLVTGSCSCRDELRCFRGIVHLLASAWKWRQSREVLAVDGSLSGSSVKRSLWRHQKVSQAGRLRELRRFKAVPRNARLHARQYVHVLDKHCKLLRDEDGSHLWVPRDTVTQNRGRSL